MALSCRPTAVCFKGSAQELRSPEKILPRMQLLEYLRAFLIGRIAWSQLNALLIISGAFGLFDKKTVLKCGGYRVDTVGEDMELVVRMHRLLREEGRPYSIRFVPEAFCWTEVPETVSVLSRQRARWQRGLIDSLRFHRKMFLNPRYGKVGLLSSPYFLFVEALGPVIELLRYVAVIASLAFGWINWLLAVLFANAAVLLGTAVSLAAIRLEEDLYFRYPDAVATLKLIWCARLDNVWYRPLTALWRLTGLLQYLRGTKTWGHMERRGFGEVEHLKQNFSRSERENQGNSKKKEASPRKPLSS